MLWTGIHLGATHTQSHFTVHNRDSWNSLTFTAKISNLKFTFNKYQSAGQKVFKSTSPKKTKTPKSSKLQVSSLPTLPPTPTTKSHNFSGACHTFQWMRTHQDSQESGISILLAPPPAASVLPSKYLSTFLVFQVPTLLLPAEKEKMIYHLSFNDHKKYWILLAQKIISHRASS